MADAAVCAGARNQGDFATQVEKVLLHAHFSATLRCAIRVDNTSWTTYHVVRLAQRSSRQGRWRYIRCTSTTPKLDLAANVAKSL